MPSLVLLALPMLLRLLLHGSCSGSTHEVLMTGLPVVSFDASCQRQAVAVTC